MQRGAKAAFEGCQVQKSQDTGNFVRIAGMIAIITLISTVVAASFIYHILNNLVSATPEWSERQIAGIGNLSMSR
jgi:hypothetical protein